MSSDATVPREKERPLARFNAIDLVTIAVMAVLLRFVFLYVYKSLYVVFPWNQAIFPLFIAFTMAVVMKIVPKLGAVFLWTVMWQLINLFIQGELPIYVVGAMAAPILAELVIWAMDKRGHAIDSVATIVVATMVYTLATKVWDWFALNSIFEVPYPLGIAIVVSAVAILIANNAGAWAGIALGQRVRQLLG